MLMTFVLHPLSHYNSITEPRAQFLLSLLEDISIDFPSHFILSPIDVYRDTTTCDKLIVSFGYHIDTSPFFRPLSRLSSFFRDGCHKRYYRSTERGTAQIEVAPDKYSSSSSFYCSIHLRPFVICRWSDA